MLEKLVLLLLEEEAELALLLFCFGTGTGVVEDVTGLPSFLLTLDEGRWGVFLVPLVGVVEAKVMLVMSSSSLSTTFATILACSSMLRPT